MLFDFRERLDGQNSDTLTTATSQLPFKAMLLAAFVVLTVFWTAPAEAGKYEPLENIRNRAVEFVRETADSNGMQLQIKATALDPRLKLPACSRPLTASRAPGSGLVGRTAVAVECQGEHSWKLYVRLQVRAMGRVVVARQTLVRGDRIDKSDIHIVKRDLTQISANYTDDPRRVIGRMLRRSVRADEVIPLGALAARTLVHTGQKIRLISANQEVKISMTGIALSDGAEGDQIRVRNHSSGRIVEGTVIGDGIVNVGGPRPIDRT